MFYIRNNKSKTGNYGEPHTVKAKSDFALPDNFIPLYIECKGFVNITVKNGTVTSIEKNEQALEKYTEEFPDKKDEVTANDTEFLLELAADHEERICLLELGV